MPCSNCQKARDNLARAAANAIRGRPSDAMRNVHAAKQAVLDKARQMKQASIANRFGRL